MPRRGVEELAQLLRDARSQVAVGGSYVHFKHPEQSYQVLSLAILEASEEVVVVYRALYGAQFTFVRPLSSWLESVVWEGVSVQRFRKV